MIEPVSCNKYGAQETAANADSAEFVAAASSSTGHQVVSKYFDNSYQSGLLAVEVISRSDRGELTMTSELSAGGSGAQNSQCCPPEEGEEDTGATAEAVLGGMWFLDRRHDHPDFWRGTSRRRVKFGDSIRPVILLGGIEQ
jgi:hypothetical protein